MLSFPFLRSPDQCQQSSICVRFVRGEWAPLLDPPVRWGGPAAWDRDGRNRTFRFPQLLRNIITSLLLSSPSAGFDLNPKVPLLPVLHKRTPRGGRVSFWTAACPSGCTNSDKSLSTSTARSRANPEPADTRGWSDLTACRHMGACTRARTHTHTPNYLRDGESRCGLGGRAVTHTQGAGRLHKAVSLSTPPLPMASFNGKTTAEL